MGKVRHFVLNEAEYQFMITTLQGCVEEFEELMKEVSWFTTEQQDRLVSCLEIMRTCETPF